MLENLRKFAGVLIIGAVICAILVSPVLGQTVWKQHVDHMLSTGARTKSVDGSPGSHVFGFTDQASGTAFRAEHFQIAFLDTTANRRVFFQRFRLGPTSADTTWIDWAIRPLVSGTVNAVYESYTACDGVEISWLGVPTGYRVVYWEARR